MDYLKKIQIEFSHIRAYEEFDFDWKLEANDLLNKKSYQEAEIKFKMLVMSQPHHPDGFEGLARVYLKVKRMKEAHFFIDEALKKANAVVKMGTVDPTLLDRIHLLKEKIG